MNIKKDLIPLPADFPLRLLNEELPVSTEDELQYHWHECLEISYVKSGAGCYYVNGEVYNMESEDIIIFNNIEPHAWKVLPPEPMIQPVLVFNPALIWGGDLNLFDY